MARPAAFDDDLFLRLWARHGYGWSWQQYADAISDALGLEGADRIGRTAISVRVSRQREAWAARGIIVPERRVSTSDLFAAWPPLPRQMRNRSLYRFLEYEAVFLAKGEQAVPPSIRGRWRSMRNGLLSSDEVVRYDPDRGLYRSPRVDVDGPRGVLVESRASYLDRHPEETAS